MLSNHTIARRWRLPALLASLSLLAGLALQPTIAAKPVEPTFVDYAQCANGAPPSTALDCPEGWINGILQASNSHYAEDQVTPQRAEVNVPTGASTDVGSHSMTFTYQARKGSAQTHAYDSLATWNWTQTGADRCEGLSAADCVGGTASTFPIPDDTTALEPHTAPSGTSTATHMLPTSTQEQCDAYQTTIPSRCFEMYGGIIDSVSAYTHSCTATGDCANASVDDYATITIFYHTTSVPQKVQLLFGGHLAVGSQGGPRTWGLGNGASDISGGPYHIKWEASDGASIGNRDNQIMGSAIIFQDTTIATQVWNTNGANADTAIADDGHVNIGTVAYDTATLSGNTATAGGTVTYYVEKDDATCSIAGATALGTKNVANGVVPNSDNYTFTTAGTYEFWAVYSGDANNNTSTSLCGSETVIVNANTTTATQVRNTNGTDPDTDIADGAHVNIGTVAYDTATLSGNTATAGGTVTYYVEKDDATCSIAGATALGTKNVASGVVPASDNYTFTSSGTYEFWAVYSGDSFNNGSTSTCLTETVIVNADTATATQVRNTNATLDMGDDSDIADGAHVNIGTVAYDTATLSGNTADAGGTVTYYVEKDATCSIAGATALGTKNVVNGVVPDSDTYEFTSSGTYEFWAVYSGDSFNNGSTSTCGSETVIVNADTTTTTQVRNTNGANPDTDIADGGHVAIGTVAYDTATLSGNTATAGGTVTYYVEKGDATCSIPGATALGTKNVVNGAVQDSNTYTFTSAGTYEFWAVYTGDSFNNGSTSTCLTETVIVDPNSPAPHSTPVVQIKDTFNVTGFTSDATGNVVVGLYTSATCTTGQQGSDATFTVAQAIAGAETSFVAVLAGTYYYKISYAGDDNNNAFSSCAEVVGVTITSLP